MHAPSYPYESDALLALTTLVAFSPVACPSKRLLYGAECAHYQDSDSFSTTSFLASTREQSSQRFLSGSMVSL